MNRKVLIIGGSSGIGLATAKFFIDDKDTVINVSRTECPLKNVINIKFDIAKTKEIGELFLKITERIEHIDVLIYSAGFSMASPLETVDAKDYRYLFDVNYFGVLETIKYALPYFNKNGRIILVSSIAGEVPIYYDAFYSASKAALNMTVLALQCEMKKNNIFISSVMPGGTQTDFTFKRKVYPLEITGIYKNDMKNAVDNLAKTEQNGSRAYKVAGDIYGLANMEQPPIFKVSGVINKLYYRLNKIVSRKTVTRLCENKYLKEVKKPE